MKILIIMRMKNEQASMGFDSDDVNVNNDDVITISFLLGGSSILILNFARRSVSPWKIMVKLAEKL